MAGRTIEFRSGIPEPNYALERSRRVPGVPPAVGVLHCQLPADGVATDEAATDQAPGQGAGPCDRHRRGDVVEAVRAAIAEAGERPERTLVVTDALDCPGRAARPRASGSSTSPPPAPARPSSPACRYERLRRRPPRADPRRASQAPVASSWRRVGLRYPEGSPMEASTPVKPLDQAASGAETRAGALPNLIVIGAQKCGTSVLHYYLSLHPEVSMSRPKELNFFIEERNWPRGARLVQGAVRRRRARPRRGVAQLHRLSRSTRGCRSGWPRSSPTRS